ncbi:hypothetical protein V2W45_1353401 [Cenococcum geophilum]
MYFITWSGEQADRQANMTGRLMEVWCGAGRSRLQKTGKASGYFFRRATCRCSDSPDIHSCATKVEILKQCGQTREQTCIQRIQKPRGTRGGCTSTIVMLCGSPGRCGRRTAQGSDTAPIAPISSTGTTQPLRVQHCHRARPIRNSRAAGLIHQWLEACQARLPPCQKVSGQPETDANLKVSRTGEKLRSSTHTLQHLTQQRNTRQSV